MNAAMTAALCILILTAYPTLGAVGERGPPEDLRAQLQALFAAKCSECHGPRLQRPKGGLTLDDPDQLAANPDLVAASRPSESALWDVIRTGEMPPSQARAGPLSEPEKETVRAWIASLPPVRPADASPAPPHPPRLLLGWLGRFHVVAVHFPIALVVAAALGEVIAVRRGQRIPQPAVRFCVLLGAISAVATAALGWLHADLGGHGSASAALATHRWLGTTAALWTAATAWVCERDSRLGQGRMLFPLMLWSDAVVVGATAHFGGVLVHGPDFLGW